MNEPQKDPALYTPPPTDPRFAQFGEAMWKYITNLGGDFCGEEISQDILPLAQAAGLCCRVAYDPPAHGEGIEADPGDEIWYWGNAASAATGSGKITETNRKPNDMRTKKTSRTLTGKEPVRCTGMVSRAWAWAIKNDRNRWVLCCWSDPDRERLRLEGKPSPEAKIVRVTIAANEPVQPRRAKTHEH